MIRGIVNERLLPVVPVSVKTLNGDWQELSILLDTGSEYGFMLSEAKATELDIAVRYNRDSSAFVGPMPSLDDSMPISPHWIEVRLEGIPRVAKNKIIRADDFAGVIGPSLLLNRRITIDVVRGGVVEIDKIPTSSLLDRIRSLIRKHERQRPCLEYIWQLPWTDVSIRDNRDMWRRFSANVDTGSNGQLSLPPSYVEEFRLRLPGKRQLNTPDGPIEASCGEVEICWQGKPRIVQFTQHQEDKPPLIGMKLLSGNRITIDVDVDYVPPRVGIARMPRSARNRQGSGEQGRSASLP